MVHENQIRVAVTADSHARAQEIISALEPVTGAAVLLLSADTAGAVTASDEVYDAVLIDWPVHGVLHDAVTDFLRGFPGITAIALIPDSDGDESVNAAGEALSAGVDHIVLRQSLELLVPPILHHTLSAPENPSPEAEHFLALLKDLSTVFAPADLANALNTVVEAVLNLESLDCGGIYVLDETSGSLNLAAHKGLSDAFVESARTFAAEAPQTQLVLSGKSTYIRYADFDGIIDEIRSAEGIHEVAIIPVSFDGSVIGAMNFGSRNRESISQTARNGLEALAGHLGGLLVNLKNQAVLRAREDELRRILTNMPVMLDALDENGTIIVWNRECERVSGYTAEEIVGNPDAFYMLYPDPEYLANLNEQWDKLRGDARGEESVLRCKDGSERIISWHSVAAQVPVPGWDTWAIGIDVTEQKQVQADLEAGEEWFRSLYDEAPVGLFRNRLSDGMTVECNHAAAVMYGFSSREDAIQRRFQAIKHYADSEDRKRMVELLKRDGRVDKFRTEMKRVDGTTFWVEFSAHLVQNDRYLEGVVSDITNQKQAEEERRQLEEHISHMQRLESLGQLAGGVAHHFNNLLQGILGNAEMALWELDPAHPAFQNIQQILSTLDKATLLSTQMLGYSGKGATVLESIDLNNHLRDMEQLLRISVSSSASLVFDLEDNLPVFEGDAAQISQVVVNLITNASEALENQTGTITVRTGHRHCDGHLVSDAPMPVQPEAGDYIYFSVRDTGAGMNASTLAKLFDPFFSTKFVGRGLGLAAVQGIVRGHNGAITVQSTPGSGTTFTIVFPVADQGIQVIEKTPEKRTEWQGGGVALLVDDEEVVLSVTSMMLEALGYEVLIARDGVEGVDTFREHADEIEFVLLDVAMPRMNGEEAYREIKAIRPDAKIILSSGYTEQDITSRFGMKKLAGFLKKPYQVDALKTMLQDVLPET